MVKILDQVSSEVRFHNPFWDYRYDKYLLPNGDTGEYHYVDSRGSVMVVPKLANGSYILLKQFRYLNQRTSLEFPGGGIKHGTDAAQAAQAELQEESGFKAGKLQRLGEHNPCNGITNEMCTVFLAEDLQEEEIGHDTSEEFERITMTAEEINEAIRTGELWDGMTIVAWALHNISNLL